MSTNTEPDMTGRHVAVGEMAPYFEFASTDAVALRSSDLLRLGPVLLTFYRGAWCPYCQSDLRDLAAVMPRIRETGTTVLGVFPELSPEASRRVVREYAVDFPLVEDAGGRTAEAFGVRRPAAEIARTESEVEPELLVFRGSEPWITPMQARFVIRRNGVVARSELVFDYGDRAGAQDLLPDLGTPD